jgi:hypothetical protein
LKALPSVLATLRVHSRRHWPLAAILAVAAVARLRGINFGLPHLNTRPDEGGIAAIVGGMFDGHLNPGSFNYPALFMMTVAAILRILDTAGGLLQYLPGEWSLSIGPTTPYRIARYLSATAGIASVLLLFRIGYRLFGRATALAAAALLSLAFLHVRDSHFGVTDVPMTFMALFAFLFVVRLSESGARSDLIVAGVAGGLAASTKYNAALIALPALLAICVEPPGTNRPLSGRVRRAVLFTSLMAAAFLVTSPYSLLEYRRFLADVTYESRHLAEGHAVRLGRGWVYHLTTTLRYGVGVPLLSAGILGFFLMFWRDRRKGGLVALFPIAYYVLLGSGYTVFVRYMLPVVPFLCLAAGYSVTEAASWLAARARQPKLAPAIATASVIMLLWPSALSVISFDRLISRPDSRLLARRWVESQFPHGTTIAQLGTETGHVFLHDLNEKRYVRAAVTRRARPDLVIIHSSPLRPGPPGLSEVRRILATDYELAYNRNVVGDHPGNIYDRQDDFYLPLAGFKGVERPGPNFSIYIRRGSFPNVPRIVRPD